MTARRLSVQLPHASSGPKANETSASTARGVEVRITGRTIVPAVNAERHPKRLYGHRGAPAECPENTLPSFSRALELGVDALETDVHLTQDEHVVVAHDPDGRRMADTPREIRNSRLDELYTWDFGFGYLDESGARPFLGKGVGIVLFDELLEAFPHTTLNVDLKARDRRLVDKVVQTLKRRGDEERVLLASFDSDVLAWVRDAGYHGPIGLGRRELARLVSVPEKLLRRLPSFARGHAAQVPVRYGPVRFDNERFVEKCHRLGLRVDFWTINDPAEAERLLRLGADGIMTDDPRRLRPVFEALRAR